MSLLRPVDSHPRVTPSICASLRQGPLPCSRPLLAPEPEAGSPMSGEEGKEEASSLCFPMNFLVPEGRLHMVGA